MKLTRDCPDIMLVELPDVSSLMKAAEAMREAGYTKFDCHSPFAIHGMDRAMGLKRSPVGYVIGFMGATGLVGSMLLQWWTSAVDYPLVISGKPLFSFQAFVPVSFALTILFSAFGALFGMLIFNRLPRWNHPLFNSERFKKSSDDAFFVSVEASDPKYDLRDTAALLESLGGKHLEILKDNG